MPGADTDQKAVMTRAKGAIKLVTRPRKLISGRNVSRSLDFAVNNY